MSVTYHGRPFSEIDIALGRVPGITPFRRFGSNASIGASETFIGTVGGTSPYFPTSAVTVEAISSDANDTAAGTGAQQITIIGQTASGVETTEVLTMAGTSATSASSTSYRTIYRAYVSRVGTYAGTNVGTITIRASSAGTTFAVISIGVGQTQSTAYWVPTGYTLLVHDVHITVDSTKPISISSWQLPNADDTTSAFSGAKRIVKRYQGITNEVEFEYAPYVAFPARTFLWFSGTASGGGGAGSVEYTGYLIAN